MKLIDSFAVRLFITALVEPSSFARFILCIAVLELLKKQQPRPQDAKQLIDRWKGEIGSLELNEAERASLTGQVDYLRKQSIGSAIRDLVSEQLGGEKGQRAKAFYDLRSSVLHDAPAEDLERMDREAPELLQLVHDFLERRAISGG